MYYSVNLMYKSERTDSEPLLWEERIILVSAIDEIEAEEKAKKTPWNTNVNLLCQTQLKLHGNFIKSKAYVLLKIT